MNKLEYLVKTLSRTKRKDYENYVVNAVWNRLGDPQVKPESQKLVVVDAKTRYFIDLYFPQLNVGVECNEAHHRGQEERDLERKLTIFDIIAQVPFSSGYEEFTVSVTGPKGPLPLEEVDAQIDEVVAALKQKVQVARHSGAFVPWEGPNQDPVQQVRTQEVLDVSDGFQFRTQVEACNALVDAQYSVLRRSTVIPSPLKAKYGREYTIWFPKEQVGGRAVSQGWNNTLSEDGNTLYEYNESWDAIGEPGGQKRIVFIQNCDPVTGQRGYRFIGVFQWDANTEHAGNPVKEWSRTAHSFPVLHRPDTT